MKVVGLLLAGGLSRRMGGGDKALRLLGGGRCSTGSSSGCGRRSRRSCSTPMATRRASPGSGCRWSPTAFPISPGHWPACWPASTGPRCIGRIAPMSSASRPTRRFCRRISWRGSPPAIEEARADLACAASGGQAHPVIGLWPVRLREDLRQAVVDEGIRKVDQWTARYRLATVDVRERAGRSVLQRQPARGSRAAAALLELSETP